ncbi:MAG: hypothetical protein C4305_04965, partial [Thermoleophilia bacterium]
MDELLVLVDRPRVAQALACPLLESLLPDGVEVVDLDAELAAHEVEEGLGHVGALAGRGRGQSRVALAPDLLSLGELVQAGVIDLEQAALLEVGGGDPPAPLEVAVEAVAEDVAEKGTGETLAQGG